MNRSEKEITISGGIIGIGSNSTGGKQKHDHTQPQQKTKAKATLREATSSTKE
jgi:hypothetical protein